MNSLSSHNYLVSGNTFHRSSGIHQHVQGDEREDFYNEVISVEDTDNSDTESEDSDKVDYTVRLELKSGDFVRELYNKAHLKISNVPDTVFSDIDHKIPVNVIHLSDRVDNVFSDTQNSETRIENLTKGRGRRTRFPITNTYHTNIYDEISVEHTIPEQDGYDDITGDLGLPLKATRYKSASLSLPIFHFTKDRRDSYTIHNRPLPPIPPPTEVSVSLP